MAKAAGLSVQELYKLISSHSSTPACLEVIRLSFLHADIPSLHAQVILLEEVLLSRNELPLSKYHALLAVNQLLQTASHPGLLFLEIYLSSVFADICQYLIRRRSDEDLESFFTERGYRESVAVRKLSHKFVHKAGVLVLLAAAIKPYQNMLQTQMQLPSRFEALAATLRKSGIAIQQELSSKQVNMLRITFLRQIKGLNVQAFGGFIAKKLKEDIIFKQNISNTTRKMIQIEDAIFSIPAINACLRLLSTVPLQLQQQHIYLALFNSFIRRGNVYAIIVVHNASFVSQIFKEIVKMQGEKGLKAGRYLYPDAQASLQDKLAFYCEFLKCLQTWAICLPENEIGQESEVAKLYSYLREERKFVFPELLLLRRVQEEFNQCLHQREVHNEQILRIIQNDDKQMAQYARVKSSVVQLSVKKEIFTQQYEIPQSQGSNSKSGSNSSGNKDNISESNSENSQQVLTKFKSLLKQANYRIEALIVQSRVVENMQVLKSFQKQWSNLRQNYKNQLNSQLIQQGNSLKQKIIAIYPLYIRLKKKTFSFNTFRHKVANVLGYRLQDFGLQNFDDYAMASPQKNPENADEEIFKKPNSVVSKQLSSVTLGCQSKLKQVQIPQEHLQHNPIMKLNQQNQGLRPRQQKNHKQVSPQVNEYGIKQLLKKRNQYLNYSKQSNRSKKSQVLTQSMQKILPQSLLRQASYNQSQKSCGNIKSEDKDLQQNQKSCLDILKRVTFSSPSESSNQQIHENIGNFKQINAISQNRMNFYEVYQISVDRKQAQRQKIPPSPLQKSQQNTNSQSNLRSRLYLQKIRYSSTRRAIEDYSRKVDASNSSNRSSKASKSIINRQYKRISLQKYRQHQSLSKRQHQDYSEIYHDSSLFRNQSKPQVLANRAIISTQKYFTLFPKNKNSKMAKNYIKSKGILITNEDIEIGFVHFRKVKGLSVILYLTSSKNLSIQSFHVLTSSKLSIHSDHYSLKQLRKSKQQVIKLQISILDKPFSLPIIQIKYKIHGGQSKSIQFIVPCTFNKFISTKALINNSHYDQFKASEAILQTPKFAVSNPQSLLCKVSSFFSLPLVPKHPNQGILLACESSFQSSTFTFQLFCEDKSSGKLIGYCKSQYKDELQFLLSTFGHALALF